MPYSRVSHKYAINAHIINYNTGDSEDYSDYLYGIAIKNDFSDKTFQQYRVLFKITEEQKNYLAQTNFYILLKFSRINALTDDTNENNDSDSSDPIIDKELYSITLRPINPNKSIKLRIQTDVENNREEQNAIREMVGFDCIPKEELVINNSIINECYSNANLMEILINSISSVYTKDLYLEESYNTERYDDLLLPPQGLIPTLKYIHSNYGIYKNSFKVYFTPDKLYIYDIFNDDLSKSNLITIDISAYDDADTGNEKYAYVNVDENDNIQKYTNSNLPVLSNKDIIGYGMGDQIVYNSYDDAYNLISRTLNTNNDLNNNDKKTRYRWNSDIYSEFEQRETKVIYYSTMLSLTNVDFTLIKPTTKIQINGSSNELLNGIYSILGCEVFLSTQDKKKYNGNISLFIGKIK